MSSVPRYAFFETDEKVEINIFIKDAEPDSVEVSFDPRKLSFLYQAFRLDIEPLAAPILPQQSSFRVGKAKIEVLLKKETSGRWGVLAGEAITSGLTAPPIQPQPEIIDASPPARKTGKNWGSLADEALEATGKEKTSTEDPNVGGDAAVNSFFQQLYSGADENTRRAMMKSYSESGGTALSTDWSSVSKEKVKVSPPSGAEERKW